MARVNTAAVVVLHDRKVLVRAVPAGGNDGARSGASSIHGVALVEAGAALLVVRHALAAACARECCARKHGQAL